jgi:ABC-2 type transport system ATP-binding protein
MPGAPVGRGAVLPTGRCAATAGPASMSAMDTNAMDDGLDWAPDAALSGRDPAVAVRGLRKAYGDRLAVDDVSFDVAAGEVVALIGANGAGKTTTVECLQGLRRPDGGTVRVLGLDPAADADRLRPQIGSQLQDSALPNRMRVGEAVALFATHRNPAAADELLERFGLSDRRKSAFAALSGGERQRLFLVLARGAR